MGLKQMALVGCLENLEFLRWDLVLGMMAFLATQMILTTRTILETKTVLIGFANSDESDSDESSS
jgi:hypothetical protein